MKVLLRAPLLTNSGYGIHSRQIFEWLYEKENIDLTVECLNWGLTTWLLNPEYDNGIVGKIMSKSKKLEPPYDVTFQLQLPDEWNPTLGKINIGMSAVVETDKCNPKWIDACNKMDHVVVPSNFTKEVLQKTGNVSKPITVIPEWFNKSIEEKSQAKIDDNKIDTSFNFLIISQINGLNALDDRKNIFNTIKWICEEFKDQKDVGIILKTNSGKGTTIDKKITQNILGQMTKAIGKKEFPRVYLFHGNMTNDEVAGLYDVESVKCYVNATRGEGYGLPIIDSAASGVPIVATNWSGHLDFLYDMFSKIDYEMIDVRKEKEDNRIFFLGQKWADPIESSFKNEIRSVYNNYNQKKETADKLKDLVIENFSSKSVKLQYDKFFSLIGK